MAFCSDCGVELEPTLSRCPLCSGLPQPEPVPRLPSYPQTAPELPVLAIPRQLRRKLLMEFLSLVAFTPVVILVTINLVTVHRLTWAWYFLAGFTAFWADGALVLALAGQPRRWLFALFASTAVLLPVLDVIDGRIDWSLSLGLPVVAVGGLLFLVGGAILARVSRSWANVGGLVLFGIACFCLALDLLLDLSRGEPWRASWSVPLLLCLLPPALFLCYIHYRLVKQLKLNKVFHV